MQKAINRLTWVFCLNLIYESDAMLFKKIAIAAAVATTLAFVGCAKKTEEAAADATAASQAVEAASEATAAVDAAAASATDAAAVATDAASEATAAADASAPASAAQ